MTGILQTMSGNKQNPTAAVLVIGGGISGMQSALDLANAGIKVYLVESSPAIGGKMAQLDKTFPTNDCSMCIVSPKLVEVGRHRNIKLYTHSEVKNLTGDAGNFTATLVRHARYVDVGACTGCGLCEIVCPVTQISHFPALPAEGREKDPRPCQGKKAYSRARFAATNEITEMAFFRRYFALRHVRRLFQGLSARRGQLGKETDGGH